VIEILVAMNKKNCVAGVYGNVQTYNPSSPHLHPELLLPHLHHGPASSQHWVGDKDEVIL
jgi:hypothetical protein